MYIILCIMGVIGMLKDRRVLLSIVMLFCVIYLHNLLLGDRYSDYSYGFYIYTFPVQQTIAHLMPRISPIQMLVLSLPATFIIAYFSWWYLEKKALSLKKMDPLKLFLIPSHTFKAMYRKFSKI